MASIGFAGISLDRWIKFVWKWILMSVLAGGIFVIIGVAIGYGPFKDGPTRKISRKYSERGRKNMDYAKESLKMHYDLRGKIEITARVAVDTKEALSLAYTPGVAEPCLQIQKDISKSFELTRRWNTVAVVTDGTAVLGLGDIGPEAGMPVMEGKCVLFKAFGDVDAIPLCVRSKNVDQIVETVRLLAGSFGGVNLEDISAPAALKLNAG